MADNVWRDEMYHCAKFRQNQSNIVIFQFFKMVTSHYLGFLFHISEPPTKHIGGLYWCAKFGLNPCSSFNNMKV